MCSAFSIIGNGFAFSYDRKASVQDAHSRERKTSAKADHDRPAKRSRPHESLFAAAYERTKLANHENLRKKSRLLCE